MSDDRAKIILGASPVGIDQRHTYLLFERSDGTQTVLRGGPSQRAEGSDLANLAESTLLGSENFGKIRFDTAPYASVSYDAAYRLQPDGSYRPIPAMQANQNDPTIRKIQGKVDVQNEPTPDWPLPGEKHERAVVWQGTDQELEKKLNSALTAGRQINDAKLEYSPLYNNSNGVATLLKAADVTPALPLDKEGQQVDARNFGEDLYQHVGLASNRSGYSFDGKQWRDDDDRKIKPPHSGEPVVPLDPEKEKSRSGSFDSSYNAQPDEIQHGKQAFTTGDPDLDRLVAALFADDEAGISRVSAQIGQSAQVQSFEQWGRELVAFERSQELQQQEMARQVQGPVMRM